MEGGIAVVFWWVGVWVLGEIGLGWGVGMVGGPRAEEPGVGAGVRCLPGLSVGGAGIRSGASTSTAIAVTTTTTATAAAVGMLCVAAVAVGPATPAGGTVERCTMAAGREKGRAGGRVGIQVCSLAFQKEEGRSGLEERWRRGLKLQKRCLAPHVIRQPPKHFPELMFQLHGTGGFVIMKKGIDGSPKCRGRVGGGNHKIGDFIVDGGKDPPLEECVKLIPISIIGTGRG
ncbi:unnamed protein product [Cuscuta campestris]|uniref:Uncharacterized protein n=1 Tax=Cuscuta campestris TaxID=132261 RepID=A0A484NBA3_9ASTE|nr:unnamed protein product [Cuscuta campestris]